MRGLRAGVLREAAAEISQVLSEHDIPHFFFKGVALLGDVYRPGDRDIGDIDLFVEAAGRDDVLARLRTLGYRAIPDRDQSGAPPLRAGLIVERAGLRGEVESASVDLHWALPPVARLLPRSDGGLPPLLWAAVRRGPGLPVPGDEHHAALLVHHLVHHDLLHLRSLVDFVMLWQRLPPPAAAAADSLAGEFGVQRVLRALASGVERDLGITRPQSVEPAPRDWRGRRLAALLRLPTWLAWAGLAPRREHAMITGSRFRRRVLLVDRMTDVWSLAQDALVPPGAHLAWRWPTARSPVAAWLAHMRSVMAKIERA